MTSDLKESDGDVLNRLGDDAAKWAAKFRATAINLGYSDMDEGWLISWFANAIEHSSDVRRARAAEPELYEALSKAVQAIDIMSKGFEEVEIDGAMIESFDLVQELSAALAKARGETI